MLISNHDGLSRSLREEKIDCDLVVVGGGLSGVCAAITAARGGLRVTLMQDRPVLGGNASSEVRLWVLGATAHMENNNRWAREGGVINELLLENLYRNPEGNPVIVDTVLLDAIRQEPNITLLLNTAVYEIKRRNDDNPSIEAVLGFNSQNSTRYIVRAPLFCDASGDGIVGFLSGAAFRMGAEDSSEFDERFAPGQTYGELLGHSIYFYTKDVGRPVDFKAPKYAMSKPHKTLGRFKRFSTSLNGCQLWWIEHGGRCDTVHDTEQIKWELWEVVYGIWNHVKNSGDYPEAENLTLEWVGTVPGKRESRRFVGDYILTQNDIVEQCIFDDAVSFGGWSIDLHPSDGVFGHEGRGCDQWHTRGVYSIPYRCLYSHTVPNLFLAGRTISATHVAFGSTRVMGTSAYNAQAAGLAAAICHEHNCQPRDIASRPGIEQLRLRLARSGQHIPGYTRQDPVDLAQNACVSASTEYTLARLDSNMESLVLDRARGQWVPLDQGPIPSIEWVADVHRETLLTCRVRKPVKPQSFTPGESIDEVTIQLTPGMAKTVRFDFRAMIGRKGYHLVSLDANDNVSIHLSDDRITGLVAVDHRRTQADTFFSGRQVTAEELGFHEIEMWCPDRKWHGRNLAIAFDPPLKPYTAEQVTNGLGRPTATVNAWVADPQDADPSITLTWDRPQEIGRVVILFDADWDHSMETVLIEHAERIVPYTVQDARLVDASGNVVAHLQANHQARVEFKLDAPITSEALTLVVEAVNGPCPAAVFEIMCYSP
ncbi:FAD-dependent oxidoreductase [Mucisphaera sp.]|uniref:FAD-dependent oxidoreductase n=1 Tax=Mucisphaera sp. TaxID=2913024 RepID=UPI003D0CFE53